MRVALAVNRVTRNIMENFKSIVNQVNESIKESADIILFPESAITGLTNIDEPEHDLLLGISPHGRFINELVDISKRGEIYIGIGFLERDGNRLYDSATLISPEEGIIMKYRRITPTWHGESADPKFYSQGKKLEIAKTPLGTFSFLICGDLFDDHIIIQIRSLYPDYLLFPMARSFEDGKYDQDRWDVEKREYVGRVKAVGITTFMVNYLSDIDGCFGGAMAISSEGRIMGEFPVGREGILFVDL